MVLFHMRKTPLNQSHRDAGGQMIDFAGWEMPVHYGSIVEEHLAVRSAAGIFDVSHMGDILIKGPRARELLSFLLTNNIDGMPIWKGIYAHILNDEGKIIDDTIVYRLGDEEYLLVPNASTTPIVLKWILDHRSDQESQEVLQTICEQDVSSIKHFMCRFVKMELDAPAPKGIWGGRALIARTGYTGEDGFELMFDAALAKEIWGMLLANGRGVGLRPAGLGARDTLRLEMGYLLSGTDFDGRQSSLQTGPGWVVRFDHEFIGKNALLEEMKGDPLPKLVCIELMRRGVPRHGYRVEKEGKDVGYITSGTMSPLLKKGIAMGYILPEHSLPGTQLDVVIRDERVTAQVIKPPFYRRA
jgi:aminomethyltransferase